MQPLVAIVILNYNGKNYLQQFLPSILASTYSNKQIIIADNASTDDSVAFVKENFSTVQVLINTKNLGFAGGYNWALQKIKADYFVLLNSDVQVSNNWIEPIVQLMETDKTIAACQPKILSWHNPKQFEYAGASGGYIDKYGYPFSRGRIFNICENDNGQYNDAQKIFWASGAAMFVRPSVFFALNGFDEYFFAHMEEIDLCWRMQLTGQSIYVQPQSIVYHVGGGTLPKGYKKTFLNFRNSLIMLHKNLPFSQKLIKITARFFLDYITSIKAIISLDFSMTAAIIAAQLSFIKWIFLKKANKNLSNLKNQNQLSGVYASSIVWQFFIKRKKTFLEIVKKN